MASRILDMGDMLTLIERAEQAFDSDQAEAMAAKSSEAATFTLDDFLADAGAPQDGSLSKLLGMLPGVGDMPRPARPTSTTVRSTASRRSSSRVDTPGERDNPRITERFPSGPHRTWFRRHVSEVNRLVERFFEAHKMMADWRRAVASRAWLAFPASASAPAERAGQEGQGQAHVQASPGPSGEGLGDRGGRLRPAAHPSACRRSGRGQRTSFPAELPPSHEVPQQ